MGNCRWLEPCLSAVQSHSVPPGVLAGREKRLQPGQHGRQVAYLDLSTGDQEHHGLGNAGAEIETRLLGHAAILALRSGVVRRTARR